MARNKYPEKTKQKILTVSAELFHTNGYEQTSMQDIVKALDMSKGAIYHHFSSKEDILKAVLEQRGEEMEAMLKKWLLQLHGFTAREKLTLLLQKNIDKQFSHHTWVTQVENPHLMVGTIKQSLKKSAPILADIMRDGMRDGTIDTDYPDECAEVFLLLANIWYDSVLHACDHNKLTKRLAFLQHMMKVLGADIMSDQLLMDYKQYVKDLSELMKYEKGEMAAISGKDE
ncbi:TetR/AcrR family transcriptional regulator [Bacillus sp. 1P06AnD]|uniref:TetR/AcrR family transcriptional regulator n=1 Tax=Bacillus sp. 1P06AnD TaxID=3132208 RepID=UPI0039A09999